MLTDAQALLKEISERLGGPSGQHSGSHAVQPDPTNMNGEILSVSFHPYRTG
jgi:hypothetical protein